MDKQVQMNLETSTIHDNLKSIAKELGGDYNYRHGISEVKIDSEIARGRLKALAFQNKFHLISIELNLKQPLNFQYQSILDFHPLKILYNFKEPFTHVISPQLNYELPKGTASFSSSSGLDKEQFRFSEKANYMVTIIEVDRNFYLDNVKPDNDGISEHIAKTLGSFNGGPFYYLFRNHFRLEEFFTKIHLSNNGLESISSQVMLESKSLEVLALIIRLYEEKAFNKDLADAYNPYELKQLNNARRILKENFRNAPTIRALSREVALNENKLKKGFKDLFESTIYGYIVELRMQKARELLDSRQDKSIADVSEMVGYTNKSQFAKRFKRHFGILPKDYRKSTREVLVGKEDLSVGKQEIQ